MNRKQDVIEENPYCEVCGEAKHRLHKINKNCVQATNFICEECCFTGCCYCTRLNVRCLLKAWEGK